MSIINRFKNNTYVANVAILASGTVFAQAIILIFSPLLTRLYTPENFGMVAVFMAVVSAILPGITGKYEVAMVLPKKNLHAVELFGIAIWFGLITSSVFFLVIIVLQGQLLVWLNSPGLAGWILLAPLVLLINGLFILGGYNANRHLEYKLMAKSKLIQAIVMISINLILGFIGVGFVGLLMGNILGLLIAFIFIVYKQRNVLRNLNFRLTKRKYVLARRYIDYPVYNASTGILDGITVGLPIFFLAHYFSADIVGYYALVVRVMNAPIGFISTAVSQINLKKVVDLVNSGNLVEPYLHKVAAILFLLALFPVSVLILYGPELFSLIFGENWIEAGRYAQILSWSLIVQFVASTLSSTLGATRNNRYGALWKVTSFLSTAFVLWYVSKTGSIHDTLIVLVINNIILYIFYYFSIPGFLT